MSPAARLLVSFLVRLALIFFAGWFALAPGALPEQTSVVSRAGLAILFLIAAILVGEVANLRMHFGMLVNAIRAAKGAVGDAPDTERPAADPQAVRREAVEALIRALRTDKADVREMVHAHLERLTGAGLPADPDAWDAWWAREGKALGRG